MSYKLILDGALFSECFIAGENRYGMLRVAEEISNQLLKKSEVEIAFHNSICLPKYHNALVNYIHRLNNSTEITLLSQPPAHWLKWLEWKNLYFRTRRCFEINTKANNIDEYDIFHSFYYPIPNTLQSKKIKRSITFLDIIPLKMNGYSPSIMHRTKQIVNDVKHNFSFAISEYSKNDILNYDKNIDADKIFVAPLAASPELFYSNTDIEQWKKVQKKYTLPHNYFLSISSNDKRKNIPHIIKSFNKFILQNKFSDIHLVLVGNYKYSNLDLNEIGIDKSVQFKIIIPDIFIDNNDLHIIYSNALCFLFMSLYEGFGLPALEAMQCGTPVIASNTSSIPEIVANAGILIDPTDEDVLANEMAKVYNDPKLRENMSSKSLLQAKKFSWENCANIYNNSFKTIINS